jgi:hypothetical protein
MTSCEKEMKQKGPELFFPFVSVLQFVNSLAFCPGSDSLRMLTICSVNRGFCKRLATAGVRAVSARPPSTTVTGSLRSKLLCNLNCSCPSYSLATD